MSELKFNHFFAVLMLLSVLSAFVFPPRFTNSARGALAGFFSPISRPVRGIAEMIHRRVHPDLPVDDASPASPRPPQTILDENRRLRMALDSMQVQLDQLGRLVADRRNFGDIQSICKPVLVSGADSSGLRESLLVSATSLSGVQTGMSVLYEGDALAGKVERVGLSGAQVRLVTDPGFSVSGQIRQYKNLGKDGIASVPIKLLQPLVQGAGHGSMVIRNSITMQQVRDADINEHDVVILNDLGFPANLQGKRIGRITAIRPQANAPLFAEISVEPVGDLMRLREVMIVMER